MTSRRISAAIDHVTVSGLTGSLRVHRYAASGPATAAPLLCIHPVNTGAAVWNEVARRLAVGRDVLVPDLRGHGRSTKTGPYTASDYADDALAVLDHFGHRQVHVAGGSIGGPVGVLLAARIPERILSVTSLGGALSLHIAEEALDQVRGLLEGGVEALFRALIPEALAPRNRSKALIDALVKTSCKNGRTEAVVYDVIHEAFHTDVSAFAAHCRAPCLIVNGREDGTCTVTDGRRMAAALNSDPVVLEGVGHLPMVEAPDTVASLISQHLARVDYEQSPQPNPGRTAIPVEHPDS